MLAAMTAKADNAALLKRIADRKAEKQAKAQKKGKR